MIIQPLDISSDLSTAEPATRLALPSYRENWALEYTHSKQTFPCDWTTPESLSVTALDTKAFRRFQNTIDNGMCMIADEYRLKFLYVKDQVRPEIYFLLIKTDTTRSELWLVTFHRVKKKQFTSRLDPGSIIRPHAEREFMG